MNLPHYPLADADKIPSPAFIVWNNLLEQNLDEMIALAGSPDRLRPHCKTHKTREIVHLLLDRGVTRHKAATLRETAMCLDAGCRDVILAYQMIGPNLAQFAALAAEHPDARLTATVDNEAAAQWLSDAASAQGVTVGAMIDLDTGLHRTGLPVGEAAYNLYRRVQELPGLRPAGLHVYDAQNNKHATFEERETAVAATLAPVCKLVTELQTAGCDVPELLCGGSATFPCYARYAGPITCSPGTTVFWDYNNIQNFPDLNACFRPAALLLARVVSRPTPQHVTLDLGNKAIASDPPQGKRGLLLGLEDAITTLHNEEHWTVTSERAGNFKLGDPVLVIPSHVCPNANLYPLIYVVDQEGRLCDRWEVVARQRALVL
jgi:D-threonine aldolase